jgi:uncharacterized protein
MQSRTISPHAADRDTNLTMTPLIEEHLAELEDLCRRYGVRRLDLIGSATRDDFDPRRSDLDFLVEFEDYRVENAADRYFGLMVDLEDLFARRIDLVSAKAIQNPYFQKEVNRTRIPLYAA